MPHLPIYIFDLGGVLIRLDVGRCMRAFEALMGEENMRNHLLGYPQQHRRSVKRQRVTKKVQKRCRRVCVFQKKAVPLQAETLN